MVKGDYHHAHNNTVIWDDRGRNPIIVLHENGAGNENSTIWNNAVQLPPIVRVHGIHTHCRKGLLD